MNHMFSVALAVSAGVALVATFEAWPTDKPWSILWFVLFAMNLFAASLH